MKVLVGVNTLNSIDQATYASHTKMWYYMGKNYPTWSMISCTPQRMSIDRMRNFCGRSAMEFDCDYLVFIDDDVVVPEDCIPRLISHDKDIVAGVTIVRGYPYHPMIFNFSDKDNHYMDNYLELASPNTGLVACDAVGFSCVAIKTSLLKKVELPFFVTGINYTEDVYFCQIVKQQVANVGIFADSTILTAHKKDAEYIQPEHVGLWKKFDEDRFGFKSTLKLKLEDRGDDYVREQLENLYK